MPGSKVSDGSAETEAWRVLETFPEVPRGRGKVLRTALTETPAGGLFLNVRQWKLPEAFPVSVVDRRGKARKGTVRADVPPEGLPDRAGLTVGSPMQLEALIESLTAALIAWETAHGGAESMPEPEDRAPATRETNLAQSA